MRSLVTLLLFSALITASGCQFSVGDRPSVVTTTPTPAQVKHCREVMVINPDLKIEPLGYKLESGMDDILWFKFIAQTNNANDLFTNPPVDVSTFQKPFDLRMPANEPWWDADDKTLLGENFWVPPQRAMAVGIAENEDDTLTVYISWHET